jgi:hypothetical protein
MSYYIVETKFHFQNSHDSNDESYCSNAFQVFESEDPALAEIEVDEYCNKIFTKGRFIRLVDISVLNLPFPVYFPRNHFENEEDIAVFKLALRDSGAITPEDKFKQFLIEAIKMTIRHHQSLENEIPNIPEKINYLLSINEEHIE